MKKIVSIIIALVMLLCICQAGIAEGDKVKC